MRVRYWGTRGSIPKAGPGTVRYGGSTSCVEVRLASGLLLVLDCGTGAHGLGQELLQAGGPVRGHLLITHTHWDHIQGIPFFMPLFEAGNEWDLYAPRGLNQSLRETLAGQMQYTYFPVGLEQLPATIRYHDLVEGQFQIGEVRVTTQYLNHPALTLGYRLEADGVVLVYSTDHEPHSRTLGLTGRGELGGEDRRHADFLAGADLVIHDAQYTAEEYATKAGWGHSPVEYVVEVARQAGVRRLALFHHDPLRDDEGVDRVVADVRERLRIAGDALEVSAAAEGEVVDLERGDSVWGAAAAMDIAHVTTEPPAVCEQAVLVAMADAATAESLAGVVRADGIRLLAANDGDTALRIAKSEEPSLVLLDRRLPGRDGLEVSRALRGSGNRHAEEAVIVLVTDVENGADRAAGTEAGVTDWLVRPFSAIYARTKVRAWLLRTACRWRPAPLPADEDRRLGALRSLDVLDTEREERFDRITRLAAALFDVPIAAVSLVDTSRQWFKSSVGLGTRQTPRDASFCAHAILSDDLMVVPDALLDPRFADNPLVTGHPHVRFYAGAPLRLGDGSRIGMLCLMDRRPRELNEADRERLRDLAGIVERELRERAGS